MDRYTLYSVLLYLQLHRRSIGRLSKIAGESYSSAICYLWFTEQEAVSILSVLGD